MGKPLSCKLGKHSWEGKGKIKFCKFCKISNHEAFWTQPKGKQEWWEEGSGGGE